jgi:hypothetical protein
MRKWKDSNARLPGACIERDDNVLTEDALTAREAHLWHVVSVSDGAERFCLGFPAVGTVGLTVRVNSFFFFFRAFICV